MLRSVMIFVSVLILLIGCELPRTEVVSYDQANYITGFTSPKKMLKIDDQKIIVLDIVSGLSIVDITSYDGITDISNKAFSLNSGSVIPSVITEITTNAVLNGKLPYNLKIGGRLTFKPVDFTVVADGVNRFLYVLSYCEDFTIASEVEISYYVYRLNITDTTSIPAVTFSDVYSLDSFATSVVDATTDILNIGYAISSSPKALFISGNNSNPLRMIELNNGEIASNMIHDASGDRIVIKTQPSRKTLDPGVVIADVSTDKIFLASRHKEETGIHVYNKNIENSLAISTNGIIKESSFPKSLKIMPTLDKKYLFASYYQKIGLYNLDNLTLKKYVQIGDEVAVSDMSVFNSGSSDYIAASYHYKIIENKYADYGFDQSVLYSGITLHKDYFVAQPQKIKDIKVDGLISGLEVLKIGEGYYSISLSQSNSRIYVHKLL